jgi:hypothetical protein
VFIAGDLTGILQATDDVENALWKGDGDSRRKWN